MKAPSPLLKVLTVLTPLALAMGGCEGCDGVIRRPPTFTTDDPEAQAKIQKMMDDLACRCAMETAPQSVSATGKRDWLPDLYYEAACSPNGELIVRTNCTNFRAQIKKVSTKEECPKIPDMEWEGRDNGICHVNI